MVGFRFRVSGLESRPWGVGVSGFGFRVQGCGTRVPGSGFRLRVSGFGFRVSGCGFRVPGGAAERGGGNLNGFKNFRAENCSRQGHDLALTGLFVPSSVGTLRAFLPGGCRPPPERGSRIRGRVLRRPGVVPVSGVFVPVSGVREGEGDAWRR